MVEIIGIIWFISAIATTISAVQKHRSGCGWFIGGLIFGPLALIGIWVMRDRLEAERDAAREFGREVKCPACAEYIKAEAAKCRFCGTEFPPRTPS